MTSLNINIHSRASRFGLGVWYSPAIEYPECRFEREFVILFFIIEIHIFIKLEDKQ